MDLAFIQKDAVELSPDKTEVTQREFDLNTWENAGFLGEKSVRVVVDKDTITVHKIYHGALARLAAFLGYLGWTSARNYAEKHTATELVRQITLPKQHALLKQAVGEQVCQLFNSELASILHDEQGQTVKVDQIAAFIFDHNPAGAGPVDQTALLAKINKIGRQGITELSVTTTVKTETRVIYTPKTKTVSPILTEQEAFKSMNINLGEAIVDHTTKDPDAPYISKNDLAIIGSSKSRGQSLTYSSGVSLDQGPLNIMYDMHLHNVFLGDRGQLVGVFDGDNSAVVAKFVRQQFQELFLKTLDKNQKNVQRTFQELFRFIQSQIAQKPEWQKFSSTALVSYIDTEKGLIYTATLGASEANIYRKIGDQRKSIPLSNLQSEGVFRPQEKRVEPKITVCRIQPGDVVVWACNGLKDLASEKTIVEKVDAHAAQDAQAISSELLDLAKQDAQDSVTIVTLKVAEAEH